MNLRELLAKASPARSGDELAGIAAQTAEERVRAQMKLADVPLKRFLAPRPHHLGWRLDPGRLLCPRRPPRRLLVLFSRRFPRARGRLRKPDRRGGTLPQGPQSDHQNDGGRGGEAEPVGPEPRRERRPTRDRFRVEGPSDPLPKVGGDGRRGFPRRRGGHGSEILEQRATGAAAGQVLFDRRSDIPIHFAVQILEAQVEESLRRQSETR